MPFEFGRETQEEVQIKRGDFWFQELQCHKRHPSYNKKIYRFLFQAKTILVFFYFPHIAQFACVLLWLNVGCSQKLKWYWLKISIGHNIARIRLLTNLDTYPSIEIWQKLINQCSEVTGKSLRFESYKCHHDYWSQDFNTVN